MCKTEVRDAFRVHHKWMILEYSQACRIVAQAWRESGVPRSTLYGWKNAFDEGGKAGLARKKPIAVQFNGNVERNHRTDQEKFCQLLT
jgi:transposase-like protein